MPILKNESAREGQSKEYLLTLNVDISGASEVRIYYKTDAGSGYWDLTTGVSVPSSFVARYVHNNIPKGSLYLDVWAKWASDADFVRITTEPLVYTATKFPV